MSHAYVIKKVKVKGLQIIELLSHGYMRIDGAMLTYNRWKVAFEKITIPKNISIKKKKQYFAAMDELHEYYLDWMNDPEVAEAAWADAEAKAKAKVKVRASENFVVADEAARFTLVALTGDIANQSDINITYIKKNNNTPPTVAGDWEATDKKAEAKAKEAATKEVAEAKAKIPTVPKETAVNLEDLEKAAAQSTSHGHKDPNGAKGALGVAGII